MCVYAMSKPTQQRQEGALAHERHLVARARAGDGAAFEEMLRLHGEGLYRVAYAILGDADEAQDALQEVTLRVLTRFASFDGRRELQPWLRRIMVNECISRLRRRRPTEPISPDLPAPEGGPDGASLDEEAVRRVQAALATLPPRQRAAVALFTLEGMDLQATAEALGCSVGAVKTHLHRARGKLKVLLADLLSPEAPDT